MSRDRKDPPDPTTPPPAAETPHEREARKAHESHALDEALKETFPTSDPVSPFVPAVRTQRESAPDEASCCAHPGCTCQVTPPQRWCSDACRDQRQGYAQASATCTCGHASCRHGEAPSHPDPATGPAA